MNARFAAVWARVLAWYNAYSERDRRIILGVVVATLASVVYLGIVQPVIDYRRAIAQEIAEQQEALDRAMRFLGAKDTLRAEREDLRKRLAAAKQRLLPGGTGTLGAAALQERANALALEKGITVQSTQVLKEEAAEPFRKVGIRMTVSGELKPLAELVSGLEIGQQLTLNLVEVSRRGTVAATKGPRTLTSTVEVSGFVQEGAKVEKAEGAAASDTAAGADGVAPTDAEVAATATPASDGLPTSTLTSDGSPTSTLASDGSPTSTTLLGSTTTSAPVATTTLPGLSPSTLPAMTVPPVTVPPPTLSPPLEVPPQAPMALPDSHVPGPDLEDPEEGEE